MKSKDELKGFSDRIGFFFAFFFSQWKFRKALKWMAKCLSNILYNLATTMFHI